MEIFRQGLGEWDIFKALRHDGEYGTRRAVYNVIPDIGLEIFAELVLLFGIKLKKDISCGILIISNTKEVIFRLGK